MSSSASVLRLSHRATRLLLRLSAPSCSSSTRSFSSSSNDDSSSKFGFKSTLPPSGVRSPFADPTRTRIAPALAFAGSSRLASSDGKSTKEEEEKQQEEEFVKFSKPVDEDVVPPPVFETTHLAAATVTASKVVENVAKSERLSDVDRLIAQQIEMAKSLPKQGYMKRIMDRWGLSIDPNLSDEEKRREKTTRNTKIGSIFVFGSTFTGLIWFCLYYGRGDRDELGHIIADEYSGQLFAPFYRIMKSFRAWRDYVVEPSREKLLPDPLPPGYIQPKYTIVIEMKNVLVSPEWTYKTGYRFKLRPALEYFLDVIGYPNFEVVIYTSESSMTADPVVTSFDPKQRIMYRLYRDCTKYKEGNHIKDLSRLNRDLSKVIHIDFDPKAFALHPENVLRVPKWEGEMNDTSLVDLAELLKTIHLSDVEDVRPVLEYYSQFDDPAKEFRKRAIYMAEQELKQKEHAEGSDQSLLKRYSGRLFGFRRHASA